MSPLTVVLYVQLPVLHLRKTFSVGNLRTAFQMVQNHHGTTASLSESTSCGGGGGDMVLVMFEEADGLEHETNHSLRV